MNNLIKMVIEARIESYKAICLELCEEKDTAKCVLKISIAYHSTVNFIQGVEMGAKLKYTEVKDLYNDLEVHYKQQLKALTNRRYGKNV